MATVLSTVDGAIGTIILNHRKVNPLARVLIDDVIAELELMKSRSVRVVILRTAAGAKVFSAGHDVRELPQMAVIRSLTMILCANLYVPSNIFLLPSSQWSKALSGAEHVS